MKLKLVILSIFFIFQIINSNDQKIDIIVFSKDRPSQLYAFFESVNKYIEGIKEIYVIYKTSDKRIENAYQDCFSSFKNLIINKIKQPNDNSDENFKSILLNAIKSTNNKYIIFAVDDIIVKDYIDLKRCINALEKTNAYGFYLRLGKNITHCYTEGISTPVPHFDEVDKDIYIFSFNGNRGDWGYPCSIDMTLFDKEKIISSISNINFTSPNKFESNWHVKEWFFNPNKDKKGLFFEKSKIVNIPLNVVQTEWISKSMGVSQEDLLNKFENGLKIDINSFFKIDNNAPHMEFEIKLIPRFPINELFDALAEKDFTKVEQLEKDYPNINIYNSQDSNGHTSLMHGSNLQRADIIKFLLTKNIDVNKADKNNSTALMFAAWRGNLEIVNLLIDSGAKTNALDINGSSAISFAHQSNSPDKEQIIILLKQRVD